MGTGTPGKGRGVRLFEKKNRTNGRFEVVGWRPGLCCCMAFFCVCEKAKTEKGVSFLIAFAFFSLGESKIGSK